MMIQRFFLLLALLALELSPKNFSVAKKFQKDDVTLIKQVSHRLHEFSFPLSYPKRNSESKPSKNLTEVSDLEDPTMDPMDVLKINLTNKNYHRLDHDTFIKYEYLQILIIANQSLDASWVSTKDYLFASESLQQLRLMNNNLKVLPKLAFSKTPSLTLLSLAGNRLEDLEIEFPKNLTRLDLSRNSLSNISNLLTAIKNLEHLNILSLSDNSLTDLVGIASKSLTMLDVSRNMIETIGQNDLANLTALSVFKVEKNNLKYIHPMAFVQIPSLLCIEANYNENLRNLSIFQIYHLQTWSVRFFFFACNYCGLKEITTSALIHPTNILQLNLEYNYLSSLPKGMFKFMHWLITLDLSNNMFTWIPDDMFADAVLLKYLDLDGNPLMILSLMPFLEMPRLENLNVDRCGLRHLWNPANGTIPSLTHLSAAENELETIEKYELNVTPNLNFLDVIGNNMTCDSGLEHLHEWAKENGIHSIELHLTRKKRMFYGFTINRTSIEIHCSYWKITSPKNTTNLEITTVQQPSHIEVMYKTLGLTILACTVIILVVVIIVKCNKRMARNSQNNEVNPMTRWKDLISHKESNVNYEHLEEENKPGPSLNHQ